jgi:Bacterial-like globin
MGNGSGVSRGDRNRNARLERLRALVPAMNAIAGIDLADAKQMIVLTDHDSKVLARKTFRCQAWDLGEELDWAAVHARARGFTWFTAESFGGPDRFTRNLGFQYMIDVHRHLKITDEQRERFAALIRKRSMRLACPRTSRSAGQSASTSNSVPVLLSRTHGLKPTPT